MDAQLTAGTPIVLASRDIKENLNRMVGGFIAGFKPKGVIITYENPASPCQNARTSISRGDRTYLVHRFTEFYHHTSELKATPENNEKPKRNLIGNLNVAIGNFVLLSNSADPLTTICGFVSQLARDYVELKHEHPIFEMNWEDTTRKEFSSGKRKYALQYFDSYEVLDIMNPNPAKDDKDAP